MNTREGGGWGAGGGVLRFIEVEHKKNSKKATLNWEPGSATQLGKIMTCNTWGWSDSTCDSDCKIWERWLGFTLFDLIKTLCSDARQSHWSFHYRYKKHLNTRAYTHSAVQAHGRTQVGHPSFHRCLPVSGSRLPWKQGLTGNNSEERNPVLCPPLHHSSFVSLAQNTPFPTHDAFLTNYRFSEG